MARDFDGSKYSPTFWIFALMSLVCASAVTFGLASVFETHAFSRALSVGLGVGYIIFTVNTQHRASWKRAAINGVIVIAGLLIATELLRLLTSLAH